MYLFIKLPGPADHPLTFSGKVFKHINQLVGTLRTELQCRFYPKNMPRKEKTHGAILLDFDPWNSD